MTVASRTDPVRARGTSQTGDSRFPGLDPDVYSYEAGSKDAAAVNSEKGKELDRRLREYCPSQPCVEVETALNEAQIGCSRIFARADQYADEHYRMRDMTEPVLDRQSGVPIRVYGVVPKMSLTSGRIWRGALGWRGDPGDPLTHARVLGERNREALRLLRTWFGATPSQRA
jgi:crotonobetainyl-CoA:carnitine CoA-transferase CaiB-like acyl-CoA transferase